MYFYDDNGCCQCRCPCHQGRPTEEDDPEEYPAGERDLNKNVDGSRRADIVRREIESLQREKERRARDGGRRWSIRSDGAVTCAGSEGQSWVMSSRSGMSYSADHHEYDNETADRLFLGERDVHHDGIRRPPSRTVGDVVDLKSSGGLLREISRKDGMRRREGENKEERDHHNGVTESPLGERSDDELDRVISRLDTTVAGKGGRMVVKSETNPADWNPNDFRAANFYSPMKCEQSKVNMQCRGNSVGEKYATVSCFGVFSV